MFYCQVSNLMRDLFFCNQPDNDSCIILTSLCRIDSLVGRFPFDFTSETQHYVKPKIHPKLSEFCKKLTAITQEQVDNGADIRGTLLLYDNWLRSNGLLRDNASAFSNSSTGSSSSSSSGTSSSGSSIYNVGSSSSSSSSSSNRNSGSSSGSNSDNKYTSSNRSNSASSNVTNTNTSINKVSSTSPNTITDSPTPTPTFCIITWGDSDIGTILKEQCRRNDIELPPYFHQWINLKSLFKQHFGWEPHGGLQNVVQRCGFSFDGRAHSGLVDSVNTAKIVKKMLEEGFRFTRPTRNIYSYKPREPQ